MGGGAISSIRLYHSVIINYACRSLKQLTPFQDCLAKRNIKNLTLAEFLAASKNSYKTILYKRKIASCRQQKDLQGSMIIADLQITTN